uniref:serine/arginine-rich splicing factor SR45-like n=1 Tax=Jaculus jaculus TaxID=51337 RepID=UPI001E1B4530|nr:serine/arginine-rich splicing factor SR45-like [Jaculus jaculus]
MKASAESHASASSYNCLLLCPQKSCKDFSPQRSQVYKSENQTISSYAARSPKARTQEGQSASPSSGSQTRPGRGGTFADATSARPSHRPRTPAGGDRLKGTVPCSASAFHPNSVFFRNAFFTRGLWDASKLYVGLDPATRRGRWRCGGGDGGRTPGEEPARSGPVAAAPPPAQPLTAGPARLSGGGAAAHVTNLARSHPSPTGSPAPHAAPAARRTWESFSAPARRPCAVTRSGPRPPRCRRRVSSEPRRRPGPGRPRPALPARGPRSPAACSSLVGLAGRRRAREAGTLRGAAPGPPQLYRAAAPIPPRHVRLAARPARRRRPPRGPRSAREPANSASVQLDPAPKVGSLIPRAGGRPLTSRGHPATLSSAREKRSLRSLCKGPAKPSAPFLAERRAGFSLATPSGGAHLSPSRFGSHLTPAPTRSLQLPLFQNVKTSTLLHTRSQDGAYLCAPAVDTEGEHKPCSEQPSSPGQLYIQCVY